MTKTYESAPRELNSDDLTYNSYLKVPEMLDLQVLQSEPAHHDEMLFIVIHQAYELWFKLILHEIETVMTHMKQGESLKAYHFMARVVAIMKHLVSQIHILETLSPFEFLQFRDKLNPASGFQSTQFRVIEFLAGIKNPSYITYFKNQPDAVDELTKAINSPDLNSLFFSMLKKLKYNVDEVLPQHVEGDRTVEKEKALNALVEIYSDRGKHLPVYLLCESFIDFDQSLALWRDHHVRVVERIIGFKMGTGGSSGVGYLRSTVEKKAFPYLWEVRTRLSK